MNIQDIADFIDLVKNPEKYERILSNIKKEQDRLNDVIATVGKVSEINSIKASLEKQKEDLELAYQNKTKALDQQVENEVSILVGKQKELQLELSNAIKEKQQAFVDQARAKELVQSFDGREKNIRQLEKQLEERQRTLDSLINEYNEKVAKLRSVMV